jgi:hypothetical protein
MIIDSYKLETILVSIPYQFISLFVIKMKKNTVVGLKGLGARTNWLAVNRQSSVNFDSSELSQLSESFVRESVKRGLEPEAEE